MKGDSPSWYREIDRRMARFICLAHWRASDLPFRVLELQLCAPQQVSCGPIQVAVVCFLDSAPGYENQVPTGSHPGGSERLPQPALYLVSDYCVSDSLADHERKTWMVQPVGQTPDHQQPVRRASALAMDLGEPFCTGEAILALHRRRVLVRQPDGAGP